MSANAEFTVELHVSRVRELLAEMRAAQPYSQEWIDKAASLAVRADFLANAAERLAAELKEPKA